MDTPTLETTLGTSRDELFFLREAPEQPDGYSFTGHVAAKQSRSRKLRNEDPMLADIEKCAHRGVKVYHSDDGDEVVCLPGHLRGSCSHVAVPQGQANLRA